MRRALAVSLVLAACSSDGAAPKPPAPAPDAATACPAGFAEDAGGRCAEIAGEDCAPGTRPSIGEAACVPAGWTSACPPGMTRHASGYGCVDAPGPPRACEGATREAVGEAACAPVGDCDAAFPPAGALLVDDDFTDAQLDATHFKTIAAAVAAASPGATVAVEAGSYAGSVLVDEPVTIAGRCPAKVTLALDAGTDPGVLVSAGVKGAAIRGLTITGFVGGIFAQRASDTTIEDVVVEGAQTVGIEIDAAHATVRRAKIAGTRLGPGAKGGWGIAWGGGSTGTVTDVTIAGGVDGVFAASPKTELALSRVVVTGQAPEAGAPNRARGVSAVLSAHVTLAQSVVHDLVVDGALATEDDGVIDARETVVRGVHVAGARARGHGVLAFLGGRVTLSSSSILGAESMGALVKDEGSSLELHDTLVVGPDSSQAAPDEELKITSEGSGVGLQALDATNTVLDGVVITGAWGFSAFAGQGAHVAMSRTLLDGTRPVSAPSRTTFAIGFESASGAVVTLDDVAVTRSTTAGIAAAKGGSITGRRVLVRDVAEGVPTTTGCGVSVGNGGVVDLEESAVARATSAGLLVIHEPETKLRFARGAVHGTLPSVEGMGHGAIVGDLATIALEQTSVFDNPGIGVAADAAQARVAGALIANNGVGVHVQDGSELVASDDTSELGQGEVRVSTDTRFVDNASRVGTGLVPLPQAVLP